MNSGVSKSRPRHSRAKLSKALQEKLVDAVAGTGAELRPIYRKTSSVGGDPVRDTVPQESSKRYLDATFEIDTSPAKRARLTRAAATNGEMLGQTTLRQPKPDRPKRLSASFLEDFVDPVHPGRSPTSDDTISKWLESVVPDRCRSDGYLCCSDDDPISRQLTRSAPGMGNRRDADGFAVPPTPASTGSRSYRAVTDARSVAVSDGTSATSGSGRSSGRSLVEDPLYRDMNLAANNIYMRHPCDPIPANVAGIVDYVRQDRDSPGPSPDEIKQDRDLYDLSLGTAESDVEKYFYSHIFPDPKSSESLKRSDRQPMARHTVPSTGSKLKVSTPVPNMLYGYNRQAAFPQQQGQLISMGTEMVANNQGLIYPFCVVEFKGDGPSGAGSLWVATNQCLGASASCVTIAERLNHQLRHCKNDVIQPINSAAFSIAMSGTEARLYISWQHNELEYYMASIESFLLQKPKDYIEFRKYVRNIIDWGKDKRLNEIRDSLDSLLEESRKRASEMAKSRPPPSNGSATSNGKKPKSSSSHRKSSRSGSVQGRSDRADEPYWELNETSSHHDRGEPSTQPYQQHNFVNTDDCAPQHISQGPAVPGCFNPQGDQQDPTHSAAEPPANFDSSVTSAFVTQAHQTSTAQPLTEEQPTAVADSYWTWSASRNNWYHLKEDGSREWHKEKQGSRR